MQKKYILALDQGTTSSRAILFDREQSIIGSAQKELTQIYPGAGFVEHDPMEIYSSQYAVMMRLLAEHGIKPEEIAAIGITNQRETTIVWDKNTGEPIHNAIVWQCRRTADICEGLISRGLSGYIRETTGLVVDAYFSATKIKWLLDNAEGAREKARRGELLFGTVDTWLVWKLTGGALHITDYTNASRTMLFDIHRLRWDERLLGELDIPACMMPQVRSSCEIYGTVNISGCEIPIAGIAGDQQAALFGQTCFEAGDAKNTYGTGCFLLMNTGAVAKNSQNGLLTTIAASESGSVQYALEGSVFTGGAVMQWLRDEMRLISDAADAGYYASKVEDMGGVYIVPAFTGLGAPYWDMYARGTIVGITRGTNRNHIVRAAEEAIAYQSKELADAVAKDAGIPLRELRADGGASADAFLMQFQADILGIPVRRPVIQETTALGAAYLAGLAVGFWDSRDELVQLSRTDKVFEPQMPPERAQKLLRGWKQAVRRTISNKEDLQMPALTLLPVAGWMNPVVIEDSKDMVLIDCPLTEFYGEFLDTAKAKGVDLSRLTYVIITHQDSDHASSLPLLKKDFPAVKVISSVIEKEYLEMRKKHIRLGHIEKKLLDVPEDVTQTLLDQIKAFEALVPVNVDIAAEDGQVIDICGGIEIIASPGHLPGHIAVYVRELKALVTGDAMNTENGALQTANPLYTLDMDEAARSTEKFMGYDIRQVVCYHGGIFTGDCQAAMQKVLEDYKEKRGV